MISKGPNFWGPKKVRGSNEIGFQQIRLSHNIGPNEIAFNEYQYFSDARIQKRTMKNIQHLSD